MNDYYALESKLREIFAFADWLEDNAPGWSASQPEFERLPSGRNIITFSLRRGNLPVAICDSPIDALEHIGNPALFQKYIQNAVAVVSSGRQSLNRNQS